MSEILDDMFDEALRFEQEEHVEREYEIEYKDKQISSLKAALAEKDARIKELEALVEKMKNCDNCRHGADWDTCDACLEKDDVQWYSKWEPQQ